MDAEFWHERWGNNQIAFHEGEPNSRLVEHFGALDVPDEGRVFVPFCGKTRDIAWLLAAGCRVAGAELSELAIQQLFADLDVEPEVSRAGSLTRYQGAAIDLFVGDFFELTAADLGPVDAVYDRAALVALPLEMRRRYAAHLTEVTDRAPQLLITFEYDQASMDGPPFSIAPDEVDEHYAERFEVTLRQRAELAGGLKGISPVAECAWLLRPRTRPRMNGSASRASAAV